MSEKKSDRKMVAAVGEIEQCRHVTAAIHVRVEAAIMIHQKRIQTVLLANQPEFFDLARSKIRYLDDHAAAFPAFGFHRAPIAREHPGPDRQTNQIESQERQRQIDRDRHACGKRAFYSDSSSTRRRMRLTS